MFLDLSGSSSLSAAFCEPEKSSWTYPEFTCASSAPHCYRKNVLGPICAVLRSPRHSVNLKNIPGPIRCSLPLVGTHLLPGKCSWTYLRSSSLPAPCVDLKNVRGPIEVASPPSPNGANLKNVPGPIWGSLGSVGQSARTGRMFLDPYRSSFCFTNSAGRDPRR